MCRLAAFPPKTPPEMAHEIMSNMVGANDDGVGVSYVKKNEFVLQKYPFAYQDAVVQKKPLWSHMPYAGWTIAHVRLATHGGNKVENTHPIVRGHIAVVHNGVFYDSRLVRAALADSVKWQGETDSEVAAYMLNKLGAEEFYKVMPSTAGAYLSLNRDGSLTAIRLSGDMDIQRMTNDTFIIASQFPRKWDSYRCANQGIMTFDPEGHASGFKFEDKTFSSYKSTWDSYRNGSYESGGYGYGCHQVGSRCDAKDRSTKKEKTCFPSASGATHEAIGEPVSQVGQTLLPYRKKKVDFSLFGNWPDDDKAWLEMDL